MTDFRIPAGGRVDRSQPLRFTFNGRPFTGFRGDTLASALLANGVHQVGADSHGRPRGITAAGVEEASALVQVVAPFPEPMLTAPTVELFDGLIAHGLHGQGTLATEPDPARYDARHAHCEVLVVGAGPAGLMAALTAARAGVRVILLDDQPEAGGALLGSTELVDGAPALNWVAAALAELQANPRVRVLGRTTAFGIYDDGFVLALQKRTEHLEPPVADVMATTPARQRVWRIRSRQVVLATGAHERPIVFADNHYPGIMLAASARSYLHRYGVLVGRQLVVFTTNDSAYPAATDLAAAGAQVTLLDARSEISQHLLDDCLRAGVVVLAATVVSGAIGGDRVAGVRLARWPDGTAAGQLACDALLLSGGWNPVVHLYSQARGRLHYDAGLGAFRPGEPVDGVRAAGAGRGILDLAGCLRDGAAAAVDALAELGISAPAPSRPSTTAESTQPTQPGLVLWRVPTPTPEREYVDLQRESTTADVLRAIGAGLRSVEHVKRYTTIGTAHDQGKTSGLIASGIIAESLGIGVAELGVTTFRPPYTPVAFAALAGRNTGALHDPVRTTAIHPWHVAHGARFENVGQWRRPWYYPKPGEDRPAAVVRECRAAREGVAFMDGSTLGKIDVQGPDAAELLDRLYTNLMSTLKIGFVRYGVMCALDGMILDDGTVLRVDEQRYLLTTTTGNAATVLDWMEEWLQTEWPQLQVTLTSVTEHWVTVVLVGPQSRAVLARLCPRLDVANEAFGFMTWRDAAIDGVPVRVARISFSGELAYEINVSAWYGQAIWEAVAAAGSSFGITPYGTETMHVLRAEKGFPIIGQDTDGTVTPQDLGMSWVVSKKKPDFIGKRSFLRPENERADRKQLVGLLPVDPALLLAEGAQLVDALPAAGAPVTMQGHVTSSYRSAALGRTFALALLRSGRARIGETIQTYHDGAFAPAVVTSSMLYDPEGARRDG